MSMVPRAREFAGDREKVVSVSDYPEQREVRAMCLEFSVWEIESGEKVASSTECMFPWEGASWMAGSFESNLKWFLAKHVRSIANQLLRRQ